MSKADIVIMYDSPEAATFTTGIEGWVSSTGFFYGKDEHMARYAGCTHKKCGTCSNIVDIRSYCITCRNRDQQAKFSGYPLEKWDGVTPLCIFDDDRYFFDESELLDYLADLEEGEEPQIVKCKPGYLGLVSEDNWCDDLPEDGELPDEVWKAVQSLNAAIRNAGPVCWYADAIAIDVSDLMIEARKECL